MFLQHFLQSDRRYYISFLPLATVHVHFVSFFQSTKHLEPLDQKLKLRSCFFCNQFENLLLSTSLNEPVVNNFWVYHWKKKTPTAPLCTVGACGTRHPYLCVAVEVTGHLLYTLKNNTDCLLITGTDFLPADIIRLKSHTHTHT